MREHKEDGYKITVFETGISISPGAEVPTEFQTARWVTTDKAVDFLWQWEGRERTRLAWEVIIGFLPTDATVKSQIRERQRITYSWRNASCIWIFEHATWVDAGRRVRDCRMLNIGGSIVDKLGGPPRPFVITMIGIFRRPLVFGSVFRGKHKWKRESASTSSRLPDTTLSLVSARKRYEWLGSTWHFYRPFMFARMQCWFGYVQQVWNKGTRYSKRCCRTCTLPARPEWVFGAPAISDSRFGLSLPFVSIDCFTLDQVVRWRGLRCSWTGSGRSFSSMSTINDSQVFEGRKLDVFCLFTWRSCRWVVGMTRSMGMHAVRNESTWLQLGAAAGWLCSPCTLVWEGLDWGKSRSLVTAVRSYGPQIGRLRWVFAWTKRWSSGKRSIRFFSEETFQHAFGRLGGYWFALIACDENRCWWAAGKIKIVRYA